MIIDAMNKSKVTDCRTIRENKKYNTMSHTNMPVSCKNERTINTHGAVNRSINENSSTDDAISDDGIVIPHNITNVMPAIKRFEKGKFRGAVQIDFAKFGASGITAKKLTTNIAKIRFGKSPLWKKIK
jgi:hypothetical protein